MDNLPPQTPYDLIYVLIHYHDFDKQPVFFTTFHVKHRLQSSITVKIGSNHRFM